jgi:hypothetical protein
VHDVTRVLENQPAKFSGHDSVVAALEELHSEGSLECLDTLRQGWLRDPQRGGGSPEAGVFGQAGRVM